MEALLAHLLDAASRAPSAHNTQPWRLCWQGDRLEVRIPDERTLPAADPAGHDALHGVGALLENLLLTLSQQGFDGHYQVTEPAASRRVLLVVRWTPTSAPPADATLYRMIPVRRTSRLPYRDEPVAEAALAAMRRVASPCALHVVTDAAHIGELRRLATRATALQLGEAAIARELYEWMRFHPRDPRWYRDGLNADCLGWSRWEAAVARRLLAPRALGVLARLGLLPALCGNVDQQAPRAPALCLLSVSGAEEAARRIEAGRSLQRIWLTAASYGLVTHPLSAALDVAETRPRALELFDVAPDERPVNLFRLGMSASPARSPRLPADEILERADSRPQSRTNSATRSATAPLT